MQKENALEEVNIKNEHLTDLGFVFQQTKLDNFQLNCANGFNEASDRRVGHESKKQKAKFRRGWLVFFCALDFRL